VLLIAYLTKSVIMKFFSDMAQSDSLAMELPIRISFPARTGMLLFVTTWVFLSFVTN